MESTVVINEEVIEEKIKSKRQKQIDKSNRQKEIDELNVKAQELWFEITRIKNDGKKHSPEHLELRRRLHEIDVKRKELSDI